MVDTNPNTAPDAPRFDSKQVDAVEAVTLRAIDLNAKSSAGVEPQLVYDELLEGWTRLLDLQPGSGDDPILCSLASIPLKGLGWNGGSQSYQAVSYCWGEESQLEKITCNWRIPLVQDDQLLLGYDNTVTENFNVTRNLYSLLQQLRSPTAHVPLWIDQICINQANEKEKSRVVPLMSEIYSGAENVVVWLGVEDEHTETVFFLLKLFDKLYRKPPSELPTYIAWLWEHETSGATAAKTLAYLELAFLDSKEGIYMVSLGLQKLRTFFLTRGWFRRTWTFQEPAMARKARIQCGSYELDWEALARACETLLSDYENWVGDDGFDEGVRTLNSILKIARLRRDWACVLSIRNQASPDYQTAVSWARSGGFTRSLAERRMKALLPEVRPRLAKRAHDKVLALLGMGHSDGRKIPFPSYDRPVVDLYTTVVDYWLRSEVSPDLSFLSHVQEFREEHDLPSWVPDWSCPLISPPIWAPRSFNAADDSKATAKIVRTQGCSTLVVKGFFLFTIQAISKSESNGSSHRDLISDLSKLYPESSMSYEEVYSCTMNAVSGLRDLEVASNPSVQSAGPTHDLQISSVSQTERTTGNLGKSGLRHLRSLRLRRAFFLSTTGYIGLAPATAEVDDLVYIFLGADVPFVVRKVSSGAAGEESDMFKFIGECYSHGMMNGEAMQASAVGEFVNLTLL